MIGQLLILGLVVLGANGPKGGSGAAGESVADRIALRDGSVVAGLVTSATSGARGSVEFLVSRAWAETNLKDHLARWDRATLATVRRAAEQRRKRLAAWRVERVGAAGVGPDDRIVQWIDREKPRLANPEALARSPLVSVRLPRSEVRELGRRPAAVGRLLRLAWLSELPNPESMRVDELKGALEARGYAADAATSAPPAALDRLLPPGLETDAVWIGRRAATELAVDPGLRFLRFQGMVVPEPRPGEPPLNDAIDLPTAVSQLTRLFDPNQGQGQGQPDPLAQKLQAVAAQGRTGAVVTRMDIAPDLSGVTVESVLWARDPGGRWAPFGSRTATVRPDDLNPGAGRDLAADPQIQGAFRMVETLGLGAVPPEFKERGLRMGAATQKAIGMARSAFQHDLDAMMLPVLEPARDVDNNNVKADADGRGAVEAGPAPKPAPDPRPAAQPAPRRRSVLGPPDR